MGKDSIDKLTQADPLSLSLRIGGLYDSRVGATSSSSSEEDHKDLAAAMNLGAGWQFFKNDNFGFRADYSGYANFYDDYNQYNVIDQSITLEPQCFMGDFVFSLPTGYNYVMEDQETDFYRYIIMPTTTYLIPGSVHAVAANILYAHIMDGDDSILGNSESTEINLDEDGNTFGAGCAYIYYFKNRGRIRMSADYQRAEYDATVANYIQAINDVSTRYPQNKREDDILLANVDIQFPLSSFLSVYSSYSYIHTNSNVDLYEYDRNLIEGGFMLRY
ncbi:MAG: hypothetical protein MUE70_04510 [Desulfobacterales bacterium]|nr:hypothetical protein [Desulfobacterales bacterium]